MISVQEAVFHEVVSGATWREVLSEEDRERLIQLLPPGTYQQREEDIQSVSSLSLHLSHSLSLTPLPLAGEYWRERMSDLGTLSTRRGLR